MLCAWARDTRSVKIRAVPSRASACCPGSNADDDVRVLPVDGSSGVCRRLWGRFVVCKQPCCSRAKFVTKDDISLRLDCLYSSRR